MLPLRGRHGPAPGVTFQGQSWCPSGSGSDVDFLRQTWVRPQGAGEPPLPAPTPPRPWAPSASKTAAVLTAVVTLVCGDSRGCATARNR